MSYVEERDPEAMLERTRSLLSPHRRPPLYSSSVNRGLSFRSPPRVRVVESAPEDNNTTAPNTPRGVQGYEPHQAPPANANSLPPEMLFYIEKQEEYIDQLEKESHYCRVGLKKGR
jgi:hypothetical protein